jgi:hypothetical protein
MKNTARWITENFSGRKLCYGRGISCAEPDAAVKAGKEGGVRRADLLRRRMKNGHGLQAGLYGAVAHAEKQGGDAEERPRGRPRHTKQSSN